MWCSQVLCSEDDPWLGQRDVNPPVHLWGTGRADPSPLQTDTSRVPIFSMALPVLETDGSRGSDSVLLRFAQFLTHLLPVS